eukprot:CAMPEP_0115261534 /NCGR_PEP_ID=MMETSP0270-20121206/48908_1 /TAXON_ID=71861 /ORGANISM="Scrippsiella trochoidea, Strain CCMP3099" /LENGTH=84 /DNA_ID=CAMNT_0002677415 /DNA_START=35 /DNA_END=289 /DNA_ORIENTATION=+
MQLQGLAHLPLLLCLPFFPRQSMRRFLQLMEAIRNRGNCCKACAFGLVELVAEKATAAPTAEARDAPTAKEGRHNDPEPEHDPK